ncbi:replication-relaxation family protein [Amycolatopsis azurea]|uniref:replication-relaxation family protein n=1 Tax=Amycolatopsis azurea TaxID=36819 RepID=UPI00380BF932
MSAVSRAWRLRERLGERDIALLESLREFRLMSGAQLRRLHFPGEHDATEARKARAATKRLVEWELVVRMSRRVGGVRAGSDGWVYGLSGLGAAVLDLGRHQRRRHRRGVETKPAFEAHTLAVSEWAVGLREREHRGQCAVEELRAEPGAWRWFAGIGGQRRTLKPDAFVRLVIGDIELSAFIEVDLGTESEPTLVRKLGVYVDYYRSGVEQRERGVFPRVCWLAPDTARLAAIIRAIQRVPTNVRALFGAVLASDAADHLIQLGAEGGAR